VAVALEYTPTVELGDPSEALGLQRLTDRVQLHEIRFDLRVGGVAEGLGAQFVDGRAQPAHRDLADLHGSNTWSTVCRLEGPHRDARHIQSGSLRVGPAPLCAQFVGEHGEALLPERLLSLDVVGAAEPVNLEMHDRLRLTLLGNHATSRTSPSPTSNRAERPGVEVRTRSVPGSSQRFRRRASVNALESVSASTG
jgi:hypothetical protein